MDGWTCHHPFKLRPSYHRLSASSQDDPKFQQALKIRNPKSRLKRIYVACKSKKKCSGGDDVGFHGQQDSQGPTEKNRVGCGAQQPIVTIDGLKMIAEYKASKRKSNEEEEDRLEPSERKQVLSAETVGSHLAINSVIIRCLSTFLDVLLPSDSEQDDLTHQLAMIIRHNENLRQQERSGAPAHFISELAQVLQFHIATYFDNELPGLPRVCATHRLREVVENGPHPPPGTTGANYIIRDDGQRLDLRYVERHLRDGDYVLFNRQPSLHKMSIMGHRIKLMPYSTFRLNLCVTTPYNADFDGDEMNMHVPQSMETRAEVIELMMVPKCIVSPQSNRPVMGIVQDTLLGCRKITARDTFIEKDVFMNILMWWEDFDGKIPTPAVLKPRPLWTGKQVFNLIIPKQINLMKFSSWHAESETGCFITPGDTVVRIEKGELLSGTLCRKTLGTSAGSLIHVIWEEVGPDATRKFLGHTQWLVNHWLLQNGFSIGIEDMIADAATMEKINETISKAKNDVKELIKLAQEKQLEAEPGRSTMESFENRVNQVLRK
ncbi:hypothetical protein BHM03_00001334 [Ensete ventricosum]|nr:hypothetical protein BHM03_00001334 [Ensete ventricosum]